MENSAQMNILSQMVYLLKKYPTISNVHIIKNTNSSVEVKSVPSEFSKI